MALTPVTAIQAGNIGSQIQQVQGVIEKLQAAIAAEVTIVSISAYVATPDGNETLQSSMPMNVTDTATILNFVVAQYQALLAVLTAQLAAIG